MENKHQPSFEYIKLSIICLFISITVLFLYLLWLENTLQMFGFLRQQKNSNIDWHVLSLQRIYKVLKQQASARGISFLTSQFFFLVAISPETLCAVFSESNCFSSLCPILFVFSFIFSTLLYFCLFVVLVLGLVFCPKLGESFEGYFLSE